jgi:hypothetical protein
VQIFRFVAKISSWFVIRLACFVGLIAIARDAPGRLKGALWLLAFFTAAWAFVALSREARKALDYLIPKIQAWGRSLEDSPGLQGARRIIGLLCIVVIIATALVRAWPTWSFKASSSLREDEIMSIVRYSSRGFVPAISTYNLARNHVFYNVVSSLIPGAKSTLPIRARLVSFLTVFASLALLIGYSATRGWTLPGVAFAGILATNFGTMNTVLEARGYGLIFLFATLASVAFAQWSQTGSRRWLSAMAVTCVLGTYTLPFYVVFGGTLLLLSFLARPSRQTFLAGFLTLAAIGLLYLPIAADIYEVFRDYAERYGKTFVSNFASMDGIFFSLQYFIPPELLAIDPLSFVLLIWAALLYVAFARFATETDRLSFAAVTISIAAFLAFCLYCEIVPARVASYLGGPLAFLALLVTGSILTSRSLAPLRPFTELCFTALVVFALIKSEVAQPLIPRSDWRTLGVLIERAFPTDTRITMVGDNPALLQWNLSTRTKPQTTGALDGQAMSEGKLVAVEGYTKSGDEHRRFRWEDLPESVRFVTSPIGLNYHRVFFVPPRESRIASVRVNNQDVELPNSGRQPSDPALFVHSFGHGDVLRPKSPDEAGATQPSLAQPFQIQLPATIVIELEPNASAGTCNLLFTQGLQDKKLQVRTKSSGGGWRSTVNVFVLGELASIALDRNGCEAVEISIESVPATSEKLADGERPPFGLLNAWVAQGKDRLP